MLNPFPRALSGKTITQMQLRSIRLLTVHPETAGGQFSVQYGRSDFASSSSIISRSLRVTQRFLAIARLHSPLLRNFCIFGSSLPAVVGCLSVSPLFSPD
jgi:hypothetical protein